MYDLFAVPILLIILEASCECCHYFPGLIVKSERTLTLNHKIFGATDHSHFPCVVPVYCPLICNKLKLIHFYI